MSQSLVEANDSVLIHAFDSRIEMPSPTTINLFYEAVTSLALFENEATLWEEYVVTSVPLLFKTEAEFRNHGKQINLLLFAVFVKNLIFRMILHW